MKKRKDADFGTLTYDEDIGAWTGRLRTAAFGDCAMKWHMSPAGKLREWADETDGDDDDSGGRSRAGTLAIAVSDEDGDVGPTPEQRAALAALRADEAKIVGAVLAEIARVARENYVTANQFPADAPASRRSGTSPPACARRPASATGPARRASISTRPARTASATRVSTSPPASTTNTASPC